MAYTINVRKSKGNSATMAVFLVLKAVLHAVFAISEAQSLSNKNRCTPCCMLNLSPPERRQWRLWALSPRPCFVAVLEAQSCEFRLLCRRGTLSIQDGQNVKRGITMNHQILWQSLYAFKWCFDDMAPLQRKNCWWLGLLALSGSKKKTEGA